MTNMQLAFSEYLENARHNRVAEDTSRRDVDEKIRHNVQSEELTAKQTAVQKYLGELQNETKQKEIITNAEVQKLKILTDKAIAEAKQSLSQKEYENVVRKTDAEIAKLQANTAESLASTARTEKLTPAEYAEKTAKANAYNSRAYGSLNGIVGTLFGKVDKGISPYTDKASDISEKINPAVAQEAVKAPATGVKAAKNLVDAFRPRLVDEQGERVKAKKTNRKRN